MTSEEIKNIIKIELDQQTDFFNPHGVDLKTALINPTKQTYLDPVDSKLKHVCGLF